MFGFFFAQYLRPVQRPQRPIHSTNANRSYRLNSTVVDMKSFLTVACVLLAVAAVCSASDDFADAIDAKTRCAEATYDAIKARALELVEEYSEQLNSLRGNYTACNQLPVGGEREQCHLEYGRHVVQVLLGLRPRIDELKTNVLRFALLQLDEYFVCRTASGNPLVDDVNETVCAVVRTLIFNHSHHTPPTPSSICAEFCNNRDFMCSVVQEAYEAARRALAPFVDGATPRLEALRESVTRCYYSPEAEKATCYYRLLEVVRVEIAEFARYLTERRPIMLRGATELLDGYFVCRSA